MQTKQSLALLSIHRFFQPFISRTLCNRLQAQPDSNTKGFPEPGPVCLEQARQCFVALSSADSSCFVDTWELARPVLILPPVLQSPVHSQAHCIQFLSISLRTAQRNSPDAHNSSLRQGMMGLIIPWSTQQSTLPPGNCSH